MSEAEGDRLAAAIEKVLFDSGLARKLGASGRAMALEKFSAEETIGQLRRLLERAAGNRQSV